MRTFVWIVGIALAAAAPPPAPSADLPSAAMHPAFASGSYRISISEWGSAGMEHVLMPERLPAGQMRLTVGGNFAKASNLLVPPDSVQVFGQRARVIFTPHDFLDVGLAFSAWNVLDSAIPGNGFRSVATPSLLLKWSDTHRWATRLGAALELAIPAGQSGIVIADSALWVWLLAGWHPVAQASVALNIGYVYDRGRFLSGTPQSIAQRFASRLTLTDRLLARAAASWQFDTASGLWEPLVELAAEIGVGQAHGGGEPIALSLGGKWSPPWLPALSVAAGADVRLAGAPAETSSYAGIAPWTAYARVSLGSELVHKAGRPPPPLRPCPANQPTSVMAAVAAADHVLLRGRLHDKAGGPVSEATITVEQVSHADVVINRAESEFATRLLACAEGKHVRVTVSAPEFESQVYEVPCTDMMHDPNFFLNLVYAKTPRPTSLHCQVIDADTGAPISRATLFSPGRTAEPLMAHDNGTIELHDTKPGRAVIRVKAPGYVTQELQLTLDVGSSIIINVDLHRESFEPRGKHKRETHRR